MVCDLTMKSTNTSEMLMDLPNRPGYLGLVHGLAIQLSTMDVDVHGYLGTKLTRLQNYNYHVSFGTGNAEKFPFPYIHYHYLCMQIARLRYFSAGGSF